MRELSISHVIGHIYGCIDVGERCHFLGTFDECVRYKNGEDVLQTIRGLKVGK